jgi:hypothetical protein
MARKSDFDFEEGERRHASMTAEQRLAEARLFERVAPGLAQPPATIFVTSDPLPEGAIALVIRNPAPDHGRLLVIYDGVPLEFGLLTAAKALAFDEQRTSSATVERRIRVFHDGRLTDEGGVEVGRVQPGGVTEAELSAVRHWFVPSTETHIPGVGKGRFLRF